MNLILILFCVFSIQWSEPYSYDVLKKKKKHQQQQQTFNVVLYLDI